MRKIKEYVGNLRTKLADIIANHEVWDTLYTVLDELNIDCPNNDDGLGKARYLSKVTELADEATIINAAKKIVMSYPGKRSKPSILEIQILQNNLWWIENKGIQEISAVSRYRLAESLENIPFWGRLSISELFTPLVFSLENNYYGKKLGVDGLVYEGVSDSAAQLSSFLSGIVVEPSRISTAEFFRKIGIIDWPDQRLFLVLERIVHPEVQDREFQEELVNKFNTILATDSYELRHEGFEGGSPVYKIKKKGSGVKGTPKYIIFASLGFKPDIVIDDTISMDIRVVKNADHCLIYDQSPPDGDLTWEMLLTWWASKQKIQHLDDKVRQEFGKRLRASLQSNPERIFFDTYFKMVKPKYGANLPALFPQVYLHYDPRNRNERETPILIRQRMDFLLLLRDSTRIILEIDGIQHYADENLHASTRKYAEMVSEDRRIRLLGYEIYRFGVDEIKSDDAVAHQIITGFFDNLFARHRIHSP